jgi:hypothetical protein
VLGHVIKKNAIGPGHDHLPFEFFRGRLDGPQFLLDFLTPLIGAEFLAGSE